MGSLSSSLIFKGGWRKTTTHDSPVTFRQSTVGAAGKLGAKEMSKKEDYLKKPTAPTYNEGIANNLLNCTTELEIDLWAEAMSQGWKAYLKPVSSVPIEGYKEGKKEERKEGEGREGEMVRERGKRRDRGRKMKRI